MLQNEGHLCAMTFIKKKELQHHEEENLQRCAPSFTELVMPPFRVIPCLPWLTLFFARMTVPLLCPFS